MAEIGCYCPQTLRLLCLQLCLLTIVISLHLNGWEKEFTHLRRLSIAVLQNGIKTRIPSVSLLEFGH